VGDNSGRFVLFAKVALATFFKKDHFEHLGVELIFVYILNITGIE